MKNKVLLLILFFGIVFTMAPASVFAMNNKEINEKSFKEHYKFYLTKPTKAQINAVGSSIAYYKQLILDDVDGIYNFSQEEEYIPEIRVLIDERYTTFLDRIKNLESIDEIVEGEFSFFGMTLLVYTDDFYKELYAFDSLTLLNKENYDGYANAAEFKSSLIDQINTIYDCYKDVRYYYNDYYWSIIEGNIEESEEVIENSTDMDTLADALGEARVKLFDLPEFAEFASDLHTESWCDMSSYDDSDYEDDADATMIEQFGLNPLPEADLSLSVYTENELDKLKRYYRIYLENYVDRQLEIAGYNSDELFYEYDSIIDQIIDSENANEIVALGENAINSFVKQTGVEYKDYNNAKYKRLLKQLDALDDTYLNPATYTEQGLSNNESILDLAKYSIDPFEIYKDVEIPQDYVENVKSVLEQTPTYKEELKQLKTERINVLNKFKNNKKYNQTKVVPIVNEGIKKINNCTTIEAVWSVYNTYYKKALATINKYKITTSKIGYGTITPSKTITYGSNYTVTMTPKKGYKIKSVTVDGKAIKVTTKYTFKKVVKNHTIKVVFVKK